MTKTLRSILTSLESATGPSPELDARIWCALNNKLYSDFWVSDRGELQALYRDKPRSREQASRLGVDVQPWSASTDACMSLAETLLPGRQWQLNRKSDGSAFAAMENPVPGNRIERLDAATPALALLAIIIKTIIIMNELGNV